MLGSDREDGAVSEREFAVAIEVIHTIDRDDWQIVTQEELLEVLNRVALDAIDAVRQSNPEFKVKRLRSIDMQGWVG